jgi:hypothetical protein
MQVTQAQLFTHSQIVTIANLSNHQHFTHSSLSGGCTTGCYLHSSPAAQCALIGTAQLLHPSIRCNVTIPHNQHPPPPSPLGCCCQCCCTHHRKRYLNHHSHNVYKRLPLTSTRLIHIRLKTAQTTRCDTGCGLRRCTNSLTVQYITSWEHMVQLLDLLLFPLLSGGVFEPRQPSTPPTCTTSRKPCPVGAF